MNPVITEQKAVYTEGQLLFHPLHGLCVVKALVNQPELSEGLCYWIEPRRPRGVSVRFFITVPHIHEAGFHIPISRKDAEEILTYFRNGGESEVIREENEAKIHAFVRQNTAWAFAKALSILSHSPVRERSREERKLLQRSIDGLVKEFAFVLEMSLAEASSLIKNNLKYTKENEWVRNALQRMSQNEEK